MIILDGPFWRRGGPIIDAGIVPLPGEEKGQLKFTAAEWVAVPYEESQQLNGLRLHTNQEVNYGHGVGERYFVINWRHGVPCITSLKERK